MKTQKNPKFEVYETIGNPLVRNLRIVKDAGPEYRWRLIAPNGEILAVGEGYTTEKDARRAVSAVKRAVLKIAEQEGA
jgi:uncharacterized protein YegP (UPF0339 family)